MGCLLACLLCLQVTADHLENQQSKNSLGKEKYTLEKKSDKNVHFWKANFNFLAKFWRNNTTHTVSRVGSPRKGRPIIQIRRDIKHNNLM